ncbi:MAG TPA: glycerophosphodiester phosphodiesterase [Burkholderiales bacterium]|nr:glycerophosphodiester phosphodiesterase [Burkholderiales bacterium]
MTHVSRPSWPFPRILAHRGGGTLAPENTLAGLDVAAQHGFRGVEFDAKLTRDFVVVLMHDDTLDRTTDGRGPVARTDWRALQRLDAGSWCERRFAGEPVPTLTAALRLCAELGLWPNVEIKPCPGRERETGTAVAREVLGHWVGAAAPLLSSFSPAALEAAGEAAPQLPRGLLVGATTGDWREEVERLGCFSLHCDQRAANRTLLAQAAAARCAVLCYTVNRPDQVRRLLSLGVSAVVTDRLDVISPNW